MSDSESFLDFHDKLKDICNSLYNLEEHVAEMRIVKKILRSLPEKFVPKITTIEESKDLNSLIENELLGSLQTFEADVLNKYSQTKENSLASEAHMTKSQHEREEEDNVDSSDEKKLTILAQNLSRYFRSSRYEQNSSRPYCNQNRRCQNSWMRNQPVNREVGNNDKRVMGEISRKDECFECHGYGHSAFECATRLNRLRQESQSS